MLKLLENHVKTLMSRCFQKFLIWAVFLPKRNFLAFSKKKKNEIITTFFVKFDIKNGFHDSFPFHTCILLYTVHYSNSLMKVAALCTFQNKFGLTLPLTIAWSESSWESQDCSNLPSVFLLQNTMDNQPCNGHNECANNWAEGKLG